MCDYSLHSIRSRPAKVGDKLTTRNFGTGTRGFAASEDRRVAVCEVTRLSTSLLPWRNKVIAHKTAIFRQINKDYRMTHHDALELPDGQVMLLTHLSEGQQATVLQLPAAPKTTIEAEAQRRIGFVG